MTAKNYKIKEMKTTMNKKPKTTFLHDYQPPPFTISKVDLHFNLEEEHTTVRAELSLRRCSNSRDLILNGGPDLKLLTIALDGRPLTPQEYNLEPSRLIIKNPPQEFILQTTVRIKPHENTALEGLYRSNSIFCSQCEAEGFRKITYFLDRPDIMSAYTTTIEAHSSRYPVLLSNGNLIEKGRLDNGRHFARWHDPFPKPCYIFALVAGDLAVLTDSFTTKSGRPVELRIYSEHHNADKCGHAMRALQKAMAWDEKRFNLEYDLDLYMIVAVDDFNAGAMENKGLNIFNSKYVLARPQTATDQDYEGIESVVGHEYFHNWTGDRVTCRDWFQLSLKEGLTVFRDQEFTADTSSRAIKRISDVTALRNLQFPEDAGPMAHPVRPASYVEINNFYTLTVYEKGAEVIRMLHTMLGEETFQAGMRIYIARHDGQAVTTEDFVQAMEDAWNQSATAPGPASLEQFKTWYDQAGTPRLYIDSSHDPDAGTFTLSVRQKPGPMAGSAARLSHIPLRLALLDRQGHELNLKLAGKEHQSADMILHVKKAEESFIFEGIKDAPIPSLLREFSAPVELKYDYSRDDLRFLLNHDQDPFNRWEAGQRLMTSSLLARIDEFKDGIEPRPEEDIIDIFQAILTPDFHPDAAFKAQLLTLPSEDYLSAQMKEIDVEAIHSIRELYRMAIGRRLEPLLLAAYRNNAPPSPYTYSPELAGRRRLKNLCLSYLMAARTDKTVGLCLRQLDETDNMSDELSALTALTHAGCPERETALAAFFEKWRHETLVMDKWFAIQATAPLTTTLERVKELMKHPLFKIKNPNKVRALIGSFAGGNHICFHEPSGAGYELFTGVVLELDSLNPAIAARLLGRFSRWRLYDQNRRDLMKAQLKRILSKEGISKGVYEVAEKSLA